MVPLHPKYIVDEKQEPQGVLLSIAEWKQVVDDLEMLDDIRAYDAAKCNDEERIPFDQAMREIENGDVK